MFIMVWVQQIQHWPLIRHFETYVMSSLLKFAILKGEYHRVIIIEPSNQICVTITKRHALSACQSTMILFSETEWFGKGFIIRMIKKKVSLHFVWKIKWAIWWQISRHWEHLFACAECTGRYIGICRACLSASEWVRAHAIGISRMSRSKPVGTSETRWRLSPLAWRQFLL